ncbi:hypothetical protein [Pseudozobellia sp. WGM2]|nr:hypothetical protein [Pseudozobellia sp. WGM2]
MENSPSYMLSGKFQRVENDANFNQVNIFLGGSIENKNLTKKHLVAKH